MLKVFYFFTSLLLFILLTILTQVGGFIYLLSMGVSMLISKKLNNGFVRFGVKLASFVVLYLSITFFVIPILAEKNGKTPLPLLETEHLQPLNILTCILNRNYVRPELKQVATNVAKELHGKFPGAVINYLDAGFPFIDGFPLLPHLSHNDGKKMDISFRYTNAASIPVNNAPSFTGYGICEEPEPGEINTSVFCSMKKYKYYDLMKKYTPQDNKKNYLFDAEQTRKMILIFAAAPAIQSIFIEPHLQTRMDIANKKVKFQGCHSVRHDDHIHIQIK